jgi:hypothetical protein
MSATPPPTLEDAETLCLLEERSQALGDRMLKLKADLEFAALEAASDFQAIANAQTATRALDQIIADHHNFETTLWGYIARQRVRARR